MCLRTLVSTSFRPSIINQSAYFSDKGDVCLCPAPYFLEDQSNEKDLILLHFTEEYVTVETLKMLSLDFDPELETEPGCHIVMVIKGLQRSTSSY